MNLTHSLAREFIADRYPQNLLAFDEYIRLSALNLGAEESFDDAKHFAQFEFLEAMIGPFALGVISGYLGNLLFYYLGPARFSRKNTLTEKEREELRRSLEDADKRTRAMQRTCEELGHEELVEEIVRFVEKRLRAGNDEQGGGHQQAIREGEDPKSPHKAIAQVSQPGEGDHDPEAGLADSIRMSRGGTSGDS